MNITDAYRRYAGTGVVRRRHYRGVLQITYELIESMLELPEGIHVRGMEPDMLTNSLHIMLESDSSINGVTYEVTEGMMTPIVNPDAYVRHVQVPNGVRPQVGFQIRERAMDPIVSEQGIARIELPEADPVIPYPDPFEF